MPDGHPVQQLLLAMDVLPEGRGGEHSNNNNNHTLWQLRDRLFQVLFERATIAYAATFHHRLRKLIEITLLLSALISLCTLIYVHATFVRIPVNCLEEETRSWSREGVLRIEISMDEPTTKTFNISRYYNSTLASHFSKIKQERKNYLEMMKTKKALQKPVNKPPVVDENIDLDMLDPEKSPVFINRTVPFKDSVSDPDCFSPLKATLSDTEMFTNTVWPQEKYIIEYSLEYGFLRLSPGARQNTSVKVHTVILDPFKDQCFGNQFSRFLLKYVLGYNDLLMGSLRWLVDKDNSKGFIRNVVTGDQYRFVDKSTTWTAYFSAAFFMIIFTLSVSMLLRYSHHQIFLFVVELLHIFEMNTVSFPAAPLLTVVLALVGMEAIMSEFFNDSVTAFYVIIIVWIADQFDSICCRTIVSKRHWLRLFYLYHFGFYAYHYRFDGQYSFLALLTSWLFIQHSMVYFFHRYELPSIWVANENDIEYDSDASYQGDPYALVHDPLLQEEEDDGSDEGSDDTPDDPGPDSGIEDNSPNAVSDSVSTDSSSSASDSSSLKNDIESDSSLDSPSMLLKNDIESDSSLDSPSMLLKHYVESDSSLDSPSLLKRRGIESDSSLKNDIESDSSLDSPSLLKRRGIESDSSLKHHEIESDSSLDSPSFLKRDIESDSSLDSPSLLRHRMGPDSSLLRHRIAMADGLVVS